MCAPSFASLQDASAPHFPLLLLHPSAFLPPSSVSSLPSAPLPRFPVASVPPPPGVPFVLSAPPSAPVFRSLSSAVPSPSALPPAFSISSLSAHMSAPRLGSVSGVAAAAAVPAAVPALFCRFAITVPSDPPVVSSAPIVFASAPLRTPSSAPTVAPSGVAPHFPHASASSAPFVVSPSHPFGAAPDDAFDTGYPDAVSRDMEAPVHAVLHESYCSEIRRMLSYVIDLFPQAAGSPSVAPPPLALFEDFFAPASIPPQPIHFK